jgi:hypothetical protein
LKIKRVFVAQHTIVPVEVDGKLDDPIWQRAVVYDFSLGDDVCVNGEMLEEKGYVQLAYDQNYFYVGVKFIDSDIIAENDENQQHHYRFGDVAELFLKPDNSTWCWEMYVTPNSKKTLFWLAGLGRLGLLSVGENDPNILQVAAIVKGTLNYWQDHDCFWTAEIAVPIAELEKYGDKFNSGMTWRIMCSRYNYSRFLKKPELSMTPVLSMTDFHLYEEYAYLELLK